MNGIRPNRQPTAAHIRWIGGGSASGKSTVATVLAMRHGLSVYSSDDTMSEHARLTDHESAPGLHRFLSQTMDERWLGRSPEEMADDFHWFRGEAFECIIDDLSAFGDPGATVIAEGFRLLPRLVAPLLASPRHAVWLLPTPDFREWALDARGSMWSIAGRTADPQQALADLLARDALFTDRLRHEVTRLGLRMMVVDGNQSSEQIADRVEEWFGL